MEEIKKIDSVENIDAMAMQEDEESSFSLRNIMALIILNWQWFIVSLVITLSFAAIYLRYAPKVYQASVKMLIKDDTNNMRRSSQMLSNMQEMGFISNSTGIDNEVEILQSRILALEAVKDLKLYVGYKLEGKVKDQLVYKTQPVSVDLDEEHLNLMNDEPCIFSMAIKREDGGYKVEGTILTEEGKIPINTSHSFPFIIAISFFSSPTG